MTTLPRDVKIVAV